MSEIADRYRLLAAELTRRVEAVPADRWDDASPCEGWSARDVLRHVVQTELAMLERVDLRPDTVPSVDDDPVGAWATARDFVQGVLDDRAAATREYDSMFGRTTIERTLDQFGCFDLLVHAWDIARATGGDERLEQAEVSKVLATAHQLGDMIRYDGVCGPAVSVPDDADDQTKLLAFLGRTP